MVTDCLATASTGRSTTVDPTDRTSTVFTDRTIFASTHCFTAGNAAECPTTVSTDCSTADNAAECPTDCSTASGSSNSFINTSTDCSTAEFSTAVSSLRSDCCSADDFLASDFARCVLGGAVPRRGIARGGPREPDASPDDSKSQPEQSPALTGICSPSHYIFTRTKQPSHTVSSRNPSIPVDGYSDARQVK
ncbi:hypothetical protein PC123_g18019 [Phytophthora cactorum]|nr:hypothetical protein PC123_g18019 [Phytophthora cactorum]